LSRLRDDVEPVPLAEVQKTEHALNPPGSCCQLKLKVEVIDEGAVIDGLEKVANRITMGLVVAALILSAAMMMRIESRFTLLGYPGFPTLLFLAAGSLAGWLVFNILAHDRAPRSKSRT
jgi:hypothetical protein